MPRRSELLEEERNYHLVKREKKDDGELIKQVLRFLFSQIGVVILGVVTAALGKIYSFCILINDYRAIVRNFKPRVPLSFFDALPQSK